MTKNYIFRKFECELSKEETAELCFKSVRTVTAWDNGKDIPPECKRLMRMAKGRELSNLSEWNEFRMVKGRLELPSGELVTPQQIVTGIALINISSPNDLFICSKVLKYARMLNKLR